MEKRSGKGGAKCQLTFKNIWLDAFFVATLSNLGNRTPNKERFFGESGSRARFFTFPSNYATNSDTKCEVKRPTFETCFELWIPECIRDYLGRSASAAYNILSGNKRSPTVAFQDELKKDPLVFFLEYRSYLEEVLEIHIKVFTYLKYRRTTSISLERGDSACELNFGTNQVETEIKQKRKKEFNTLLQSFKLSMINTILNSAEYKNDKRIHNTAFASMVEDEERDPLERLTILSLLSIIFAGSSIKREKNLFRKIYEGIYDDSGVVRPAPDEYRAKQKSNKISKETIKASGKMWYENTRSNGGRFSGLLPNRDLFPRAGNFPINVHSENEYDQPLMTVIENTTEHLYLVGEGGIGKTTALYSIMETAYGNSRTKVKQVPLYVELSKALDPNDFDTKTGSSMYIRHSIQRQIQACLGTKIELEDQLEELFAKKTTKREYILLLDGLNEVSRERIEGSTTIVQMLIAEIRLIIAQYLNVRVILSSRSEERLGNNIVPVFLSGIATDTIQRFLENNNLSSQRIDMIKKNTRLMEILRIPLFLILFVNIEDAKELLSRGEILHVFFSQNRGSIYSEKKRLSAIREDLMDEYGFVQDNRTNPNMMSFMLDFILPAIAWPMVQNEVFQITRGRIGAIIRTVIESKDETDICGPFGKECFSEYRISAKVNTRIVAKSLVNLFGKDYEDEDDKWEMITAEICDCLQFNLGILASKDFREYEFLHHHFRDYFAALYNINRLRLAVYLFDENKDELGRSCLSEWKKNPLPSQIVTFIGEALGEAHNAPRYDEDANRWLYTVPNPSQEKIERNLLKRGFDLYRNRFKFDDGYAVWNLFQILKLTRKDLSGEDLTFLDLTMCRSYGVKLANPGLTANLSDSKLNDEFFLPMGHQDYVGWVDISQDGKYMVTASNDNTIIVWDVSTSQEVCLKEENDRVWFAKFSPSGKYITMSLHGKTKVWDWKNSNEIYSVDSTKDSFTFINFSSDEKRFVVFSNKDNTPVVIDASTKEEIGSLVGHKGNVYSAVFSPDGRYIVTSSDDHEAKVWGEEGEIYKEVKTLAGHKEVVVSADFSPDGHHIVTMSYDRPAKRWYDQSLPVVKVWNIQSHSVEKTLEEDDEASYVLYSQDGKYLVSLSHCFCVVRDTENYNILNKYDGYDRKTKISSIYFPNSRYVIAHRSNSVDFWRIGSFRVETIITNVFKKPSHCIFSPNGKNIVFASGDGSFRVWDGEVVREYKVLSSRVIKFMRYSPDGKYLLIGFFDNRCEIRDSETFQVVQIEDLKESHAFIMDGKYLIVDGFHDTKAEIGNANSCMFIHDKIMSDVFENKPNCWISDDGKYAVTYDREKPEVWDLESSTKLGILNPIDGILQLVKFSSNGNMILTTTEDKVVQLWDTNSLSPIWTSGKKELGGAYDEKENRPSYMFDYLNQISPDGKWVITAYADEYPKIWKWNGSNLQLEYEVPILVVSVQFDPNCCSRALFATFDGGIVVLDIVNNKIEKTLINLEDVNVMNLDLSHLNEETVMSQFVKEYLKDYGAIIN